MGASYDRERKPDKQQPLAARNNCLLCKGNWYPWKTPKSRTSFFLSCGLPRSDAGNVRAVEVRLGSTFTLPQPSLADANNQQEYRIRSVALFFLFFQMVYLRSRRWMVWALLFQRSTCAVRFRVVRLSSDRKSEKRPLHLAKLGAPSKKKNKSSKNGRTSTET